MEFDDLPPSAPVLRRALSAPSPSLINEGVPIFMLRRAAALVGPSEAAQRRFILENSDQPDAFWGRASSASADDGDEILPVPNHALPAEKRAVFSVVMAAAKWRSRAAASAARRAAEEAAAIKDPADEGWAAELRQQPAFGLVRAELGAEAAGGPSWAGELAAVGAP